MGDYLFKLRFVFLPSLVLAVGFVAVYLAAVALIEWTGWLAIDGELAEFWLPLVTAGLAVTIVMGPRFRIFEPAKKGDPEFLYGIVVALMLAPAVMFLQPSLQEAMWGLTRVDTVGQIPVGGKARFYAAHSVCFERDRARWSGYAHRDGRHNETSFELYAAIPVCGQMGDVLHWIAVHESRSVSGTLPEAERIHEVDAFERETHQKVADLEPSRWSYLERVRGGSDRRQFEKAVSGRSDGAPDAVFLVPHEEVFGLRIAGRAIIAGMVSLGAALLWLLVLQFPTLNADEVASVRKTGSLTPKPRDEYSVLQIVLPSRDLYGPAVLIDLIVGVYVAMIFSGLGVVSFAADDVMAWGANHGPLGFGPGNYGLVTALFLHGGLMHMLNNLYGLIFALITLLPVARNSRLILCFLVCGVAGNVASIWWNPGVIGVGASGAVLGLWGILVVLAALRDHRVKGSERFILVNIAIFGSLTALFGVLSPNVDNAAHVGGFVTGLVIGLVLYGIEKIYPDPEFRDEYEGVLHNIRLPFSGTRAP